MELFTLGVGNYSEQDVKEAARALTGWSFCANEFVFLKGRHDFGDKTFLGKKGNFTGDDIIDIIFEQPAVSRFIVNKLFVFLAHENPKPEIIQGPSTENGYANNAHFGHSSNLQKITGREP